MRPTLRLLDDGLIERILAEARDLLGSLGVEIHNPAVSEPSGYFGHPVPGSGPSDQGRHASADPANASS